MIMEWLQDIFSDPERLDAILWMGSLLLVDWLAMKYLK